MLKQKLLNSKQALVKQLTMMLTVMQFETESQFKISRERERESLLFHKL